MFFDIDIDIDIDIDVDRIDVDYRRRTLHAFRGAKPTEGSRETPSGSKLGTARSGDLPPYACAGELALGASAATPSRGKSPAASNGSGRGSLSTSRSSRP